MTVVEFIGAFVMAAVWRLAWLRVRDCLEFGFETTLPAAKVRQ